MDLNPIVLSIPVFFILIGIELVAERITHRKLYRLPDAIANLSCGITSQLSGLFLKIFAIGVYEILHHNFNLFTWERNWLYWLMLFLLADLAYYWAHRKSHEINLFWGGHVVHHQSEDYNPVGCPPAEFITGYLDVCLQSSACLSRLPDVRLRVDVGPDNPISVLDSYRDH